MYELTKLQVTKVKKELDLYFSYQPKFNKEAKTLSYELLNTLKSYEMIEGVENKIVKLLLTYFYSHVDKNANIISLEHHKLTNEYVKNNFKMLKKTQEKFVLKLFKTNKPLFFIDVDNTLTYDAILSTQKINFIKKWKNKSDIILSSGKIYDSIKAVITSLSLTNNYSSTLNGSVIVKNKNFDVSFRIGNVSKEIINELLKTNLNFIVYYENLIHTPCELNQTNVYMLKKFDEWYIDTEKEIDYNRIVKILVFIDEGKIEEEQVVNSIVSIFPELHCVRTAFHCYEILDKNQNKGNSVKQISTLLNRYYRASIGIGDSMNDLPMLDNTGLSYVVSNVSTQLKTYNFEILKGSRDTDIIDLLKKYG